SRTEAALSALKKGDRMGGVSMKVRKAADTAGDAGHNGAPPDGWIRTMRQARGVSLRQLGKKLGIQGDSGHVAERRGVEGRISIYQLRRLAAALECDLFYAFIPRQPGAGARPSQRYAAALRAREDADEVSALTATSTPGEEVQPEGRQPKGVRP